MWRRGKADLSRDEAGVVLLYVTLIITLLIGLVALAVDSGRMFTGHSEAKAAADAAALAAASQLDGTATAIIRATQAAQDSPLVTNSQTHADGGADVSIVSMRFFHSLPDDTTQTIDSGYVTTDPTEARFVEVTTEQLTQTNLFIQAVAAGQTAAQYQTTAVAGYERMVCRFPPLMICNPFETQGYHGFPADMVRGQQLLAKTKGSGDAAWAPGDFGLLDPPNNPFDTGSNTGARRVAEEIARADPRACYSDEVTLRPGVINSMRTGINVRFDMYQNPHFGGGSDRSNVQYRPARNVVKGMVNGTGRGGGACAPTTSAAAQKMPRDTCLQTGSCPTTLPARLGDGNWDRATYWSVNHPGVPMPPELAGAARYDFYRYEIDNAMIPNNVATGGENGNPQCYSGSTPPNDNPDRRVLYMAVINCIEQGPLTGGSNPDVEVERFMKMFVTEPVDSGRETDIWLEFVDEVRPGADDGVLHDQIELVR